MAAELFVGVLDSLLLSFVVVVVVAELMGVNGDVGVVGNSSSSTRDFVVEEAVVAVVVVVDDG